jgi:putative tricarboxylic transport membrane protein
MHVSAQRTASAEEDAIGAVPPVAQAAGPGPGLHRRESLLNWFWIVSGIAVCVYSYRLGVFGPNGPDSGFFPMLAGAVMGITGAALLLLRATRVESTLCFWPEQGAARRVCLVLGGLIALIVLMRFAGFLTAAVIMMPLLLRAIDGRSWRFALIVGILSAGIVFVLFDTLLGTLLPRGPLGL